MLQEGDILKRPTFAETLRTIAQYGADVLYNGTLGDKLVADIQERGGIITKDDLRNYRPEWVDPIRVQLDDLTLYSTPPPGSGVLVALALNILNNYGPEVKNNGNPRDVSTNPLTYHRLAEALKHTYAQRTKVGDPCCDETFIEQINQVNYNDFLNFMEMYQL